MLELERKLGREKKELENFLDKWIPYAVGYFFVAVILIFVGKDKWLFVFCVLLTTFISLVCLYFYKKKKKTVEKLEKELKRLKEGLKKE